MIITLWIWCSKHCQKYICIEYLYLKTQLTILPSRVIGERFTKCINLIKRGDHYNLVVSSEKRKIPGAR